MTLAAARRGTTVVATDIPERMKNLKFNVNRNQLRHAVNCVPWDWSDALPPALDWLSITQVIASEVVYYDETRGMAASLANALETVLTRCRAGIEVLLMLRVRVLEHGIGADGEATTSSSTLVPSDSYDARSTVFDFVETALPRVGLEATLLPLGDRTLGLGCGLRLIQVQRAPSFVCCEHTAPVLAAPAVREAIAGELQTAWLRQREIQWV